MNYTDREMRPYQKEGVVFLSNRDHALLADEMGLGKTVQVINAIYDRIYNGKADRVLVVTPASVCANWLNEFDLWAPKIAVRILPSSKEDRLAYYQLPIPVLIGSFEQIRNDHLNFDSAEPFDIVVLDEAQRIKNRSATTSVICRTIPRKSSWALTGTPVENRVDDIISIFGFVCPGLLDRQISVQEIHQRIQPYFLRRTKAQVMKEMPPIQIIDQYLELTTEQRNEYEQAWNEKNEVATNARRTGNLTGLFAYLHQLKQFCNFDSSQVHSAKADWIQEYLDSISSENPKIIVFSQYVSTLKTLYKVLSPSFKCDLFHGELNSESRKQAIDNFERGQDTRLLLISLMAGGVGLNIPSASHVFMFDLWWNPALENQAIQRAHRFGRTTSLTAVRFITHNSIEEKINQLLSSKSDLFEHVVENAPNAILSADELIEFLAD